MLAYLCLGLSAWAAQTVISRGFYALESTWLPTIIGTAVAIVMVPLYVVLRQQYGTIGLAIASSTSIMVYVILLGWLQRRRFEKEAAARGTRLLLGSQEMLGPVLRLAAAAAIATGLGLIARTQLLSWLPDMHLATILLRATLLCMFGIGAYLGLARFFLVTDVIEFEVKLFRKLRLG